MITPTLKLIRAYIDCEACDYTPNKNNEWRDAAFKLIQEKLKDIKTVSVVKIESYGNAGGCVRSLSFDYAPEHHDKNVNTSFSKEYIISFCPCGELDHLIKMREVKTR